MTIPTVSAPPAAPSTANPSIFDALADAFIAWLSTHVTEANAMVAAMNITATNIATSETNSAASASNAAISAANAATSAGIGLWVSGTSYTAGTSKVISPINWQPYVRKVTGAGTTDPANDPTNWQPMAIFGVGSTIKTTGYTAVSGDNYPQDTTSAGFSVTLPASPLTTDAPILIQDVAGKFGTNNLTLLRNGNKIFGLAEDCIIDLPNFAARLVYTGATYGWTFL